MATNERARSDAALKYLHHAGAPSPPNYGRVVRSLTDAELLDEISNRRGDPDYQQALSAELAARDSERLDDAIERQTGKHPAS